MVWLDHFSAFSVCCEVFFLRLKITAFEELFSVQPKNGKEWNSNSFTVTVCCNIIPSPSCIPLYGVCSALLAETSKQGQAVHGTNWSSCLRQETGWGRGDLQSAYSPPLLILHPGLEKEEQDRQKEEMWRRRESTGRSQWHHYGLRYTMWGGHHVSPLWNYAEGGATSWVTGVVMYHRTPPSGFLNIHFW